MTFRKRINLLAIIFLVLTLGLGYLLFSLFSGIKNVSAQITTEKENYFLLEKRAENSDTFKNFSNSEAQNFQKLNEIFINPEIPVEFITFLENISRESDIALKISFSSFEGEGKLIGPSSIFQINSTGSLPKFLRFLDKLESSQYLIEVQRLNIARMSETELKTEEFKNFTMGDAKINLSIEVYTK